MRAKDRRLKRLSLLIVVLLIEANPGDAQERVTISYSSLEAPNGNYFIAQEKSLYQKYGIEADSIFILASTTVVTAIVTGSVHLAPGAASPMRRWGGANLVAVGSFINTLPYELIVHESIKSAEDLRGKAIGISRIGSASDRAAAFRTGKIAGFPSPPGVIKLAKGMPHRVLITTAEFPKKFPFPYVCLTTTKSYLASNREPIKQIVMALV